MVEAMGIGRGIVVVAAFALAACENTTEVREAELNELVGWLPGLYDNSAQVAADKSAGRPPHDATTLSIVPVYAPFLADLTFYVQETVGDASRRISAQRVLTFEVLDEQIVQGTYSLLDPGRWRSGSANPDLFKSLMPQDVKLQSGCDLVWEKKDDLFTGANDRTRCRLQRGTGGLAFVESRAELTPDELALSDRAYNAAGKLLTGREDDPFYRFRKIGEE
jgi:hypothetical protein